MQLTNNTCMFKDFTTEAINAVMESSWQAFKIYKKVSLAQRADFMRRIATEIGNLGDGLIELAMKETNLTAARLQIERDRTIQQLNSYAAFCESGQWLDVRIDMADVNRVPPKPDLRKMLVPLGPVVVFGAANFPFAYSTAGGDTACAFAAGCPVIVKAHPGHIATSELVAKAIRRAAESCGLPTGIFAHVYGASSSVGEALVKHPHSKAVGFTGSFAGGKQLFDWGNQRSEPIPVFAEMSSVNPVFLLPEKLSSSAQEIAKMYAASITLSVGQFCTNPGIIIGIDGDDLEKFVQLLSEETHSIAPAAMLNSGIYKNYSEKRNLALSQHGVKIVMGDHQNSPAGLESAGGGMMAGPTLAVSSAKDFMGNSLLQQEVFGPYSIIVRCADMNEMHAVAQNLQGQLTATLMATENDILYNEVFVDTVQQICGRFILNGVPTGVEVCLAMQHGGPYPATTDSRFTSVGADGIRRFARPVTFQNWPDALLPLELKHANPLRIWRTVNGELQKKEL